jgi:hypothetical protein
MTAALDADRAVVAALIARRWPGARVGAGILLKDWNRNRVSRWDLSDAPLPSVVAKRILRDPAQGYNDWAALAYLADGRIPALAPAFLDGDSEAGLWLMSDLGAAPTLDALLRGRDRPAAEAATVAVAAATGRLHAATAGHGAAFAAWRERLPASEGLDRLSENHRYHQRVARLHEWFEELAVEPVEGWLRGVARGAAMAVLAEPLCCLTHGDWAPTNAVLAPEGARLLDFEYAGYRHPFHDRAAWHLVCPLPEDLVARCDEAYFAELVRGMPRSADPALVSEHWALIGSARGLDVLSWLPLSALERDQPWVEAWSVREAMLAVAKRTAVIAAGSPATVPVAETLDALRAKLAIRWGMRGRTPEWPALA